MIRTRYAIIATTLLGLASVSAATVSWTASPYEVNGELGRQLNTGVFNKFGTLLIAENSGGSATIFDGINFESGTTTFKGGSLGGFHDGGYSPNLSHFGTYGNAGEPDTVSLSDLTVGDSYRIQVLVYDGRKELGIPGRTVTFDDLKLGQYANGVDAITWGGGLLVTGTFVADSVIQDFTIETFNGAKSMGGQLNALLLHNTTEAPAPSSAALLSIGGVTLSLQN